MSMECRGRWHSIARRDKLMWTLRLHWVDASFYVLIIKLI